MAKETPYQKSQKEKAQTRKDVRSGKIPGGNTPHEPSRKSSGDTLKVNVPKPKM